MGQSYNGFGTGIYGKRDFYPDRSFLTTQWIILFWLPIVPVKSMRVLPGATSGFLGFSWSTEYAIYSENRPNAKQVLCVYGFLLAVYLSVAMTDWRPIVFCMINLHDEASPTWLKVNMAFTAPTANNLSGSIATTTIALISYQRRAARRGPVLHAA